MEDYEYTIRTDLAVQNKTLRNTRTYQIDNIIIKKFYKDNFSFTNLLFNHIETKQNQDKLAKILIKELKTFFKKYKLKKSASALVIGLGNSNIASDSLGSKTVSKVIATAYLKDMNLASNMRRTYTFTPDVVANTGFMAAKSIKAIVKTLKPDFIIIVDALISGNVDYLNKLIQITDKGIIPGSGLANYQEEISFKTIGIPVIAIGAPTAIEASTIIRDALKINQDKLKFKRGYDLIVSTKDIDIFINKLSTLLGEAINKSLNNFNIY